MIVYSIQLATIIFFLGIAEYLKRNKEGKKNDFRIKVCYSIVFLVLYIVMAIRYDVGRDYFFSYVPVFEIIQQKGTFENVEFGYVLLNKLVQIFTNDYAGIFIVTSFLFVYFSYKSIIEKSNNVFLSVYILFCSCFYFFAMNVVRQAITIAIFIYSIKYIEERNFKRYAINILLAAWIHKIALIFLPIYFVRDMKIDIKKLLIISLIIFSSTTIIYKLIGGFVDGTKFDNYLTGKYSVNENTSMISPIINIAIIFLYVCTEKNSKDDKKFNIYKNIHIIALWTSMLLGVVPLASRLFLNFYHIQSLSIPLVISKFNKSTTRMLLYIGFISLFLINFIFSVGVKNGNDVLPYLTIFDR